MNKFLSRIPKAVRIGAIAVVVLCCLCPCIYFSYNMLRSRGLLSSSEDATATPAATQAGGPAEAATSTPLPAATATDAFTATPTHNLDATRESIFAAYTERAAAETGTPGTETPAPTGTATLPPPTLPSQLCHPSYPTVCIPPPPPDLKCGDIPFRNFTVLPPDPHNFDPDGNGIGCES